MTDEDLAGIEKHAHAVDSRMSENVLRLVECLRSSRAANALLSRRLDSAIEGRDNAMFVSRALWGFIQEGYFLDDIEMGEPDTPEWELWLKKHVVQDLVYDNPWVKEKE